MLKLVWLMDIPTYQYVKLLKLTTMLCKFEKRKRATESGEEYEIFLNYKRFKPAMNMFDVIQID